MRWIYPSLLWEIKTSRKELFLTFDDGPDPEVTEWVLDELKKYNAKATFFCVGKNVKTNPKIFERILKEGHTVGNHTYDHLNGWKTDLSKYITNIKKCGNLFGTKYFRPPYGKITRKQIRKVPSRYKTVMWTLLSGDFDKNLTAEQCVFNVIQFSKKGSIIVFHDSPKSWEKLKHILPKVLNHFKNVGYEFSEL